MDSNLLNKCEIFLDNRAAIFQAMRVGMGDLNLLDSLLYTSRDNYAEVSTIRSVRAILKEEGGQFNALNGQVTRALVHQASQRGTLEGARIYIRGALKIYRKLHADCRNFSGHIELVAMILHELCPYDDLDEAIARIDDSLDGMREKHPLLHSDSDVLLATLLALTGGDLDKVCSQVEADWTYLGTNYKFGPLGLQPAAQMLALSSLPAEEVGERFARLYKGLKSARHDVGQGKECAGLAPLCLIRQDLGLLTEETTQVASWLKKQKGFGFFGTTVPMRTMLAAFLVAQYHQNEYVLENLPGQQPALTTVKPRTALDVMVRGFLMSLSSGYYGTGF